MWKLRDVVMLAVPLFSIIACGQANNSADRMETKQTYSLCPKTGDSRQRLHDQAKDFAAQQKAQFIDRSPGVQQELTSLESNVLKATGGNPVLLTVDKPGVFRVSITNLGLKEKIALAVRFSGTAVDDGPIAGFITDLGRFWTIQKAGESVTNDPPCSPLDVPPPSGAD
jgi:hypothetical protein